MKVETLLKVIGSDFYTGVPDSQLRALCDCLMESYGVDGKHHIIAANEGNSVGIAAGYYLATEKVPVVYMQNSGEGNIVNPVASLLHDKVYAIPMVFIIGWRGEPGVHDEPQHIFQGEITLKILDLMGIRYMVIDEEVTEEGLLTVMNEFREELDKGHQVAYVIKKNSLFYDKKIKYENDYRFNREEAIEIITEFTADDIIVSSTGKISRELFEIRERRGMGHDHDFLTVGSMGHSSSIALGIAISKPERTVWCIDGDGAVLMHMGSMSVIATDSPQNYIHVVINNEAHETVGGMPTAAVGLELSKVALALGYKSVFSADRSERLREVLDLAMEADKPAFIEVKCAIGSRTDLGRPTTTPVDNKNAFMKELGK